MRHCRCSSTIQIYNNILFRIINNIIILQVYYIAVIINIIIHGHVKFFLTDIVNHRRASRPEPDGTDEEFEGFYLFNFSGKCHCETTTVVVDDRVHNIMILLKIKHNRHI